MKKVILLFSVLFFNCLSFSQVKIDFIVYANNVADSEKVYISGNNFLLGSWNPGLVSFNKINDSTWIKSFTFITDSQIEFKFTKGDWNNEALDQNKKVPDNYKLKINNDTALYFNINHWGNSKKNISGKITGNVKYHLNFKSKFVLQRDIIVWLPPSYDSKISKRYPVLYMHDGQNIFDPQTSSFGIDWQVDETADSLIKENIIDEPIIVGIYNTYLRSSEYSNSENGNNYLKFITLELKPFIDSTYRTLPDNKNTGVAGSSMGGLISFILAWEYPEIFSNAACLSPAFKVFDIDYIKIVKQYSSEDKNIKLYIDNGGVGLEQELQPGIDEMLEVLKAKGYNEENLLWIKDTEAEHNESAWAKRVPIFLKYFFSKNN